MKPLQFSLGGLLAAMAILGCLLAIEPLRYLLIQVGCVTATLVALMVVQAPIAWLLWRCGWLPSRHSLHADEEPEDCR